MVASKPQTKPSPLALLVAVLLLGSWCIFLAGVYRNSDFLKVSGPMVNGAILLPLLWWYGRQAPSKTLRFILVTVGLNAVFYAVGSYLYYFGKVAGEGFTIADIPYYTGYALGMIGAVMSLSLLVRRSAPEDLWLYLAGVVIVGALTAVALHYAYGEGYYQQANTAWLKFSYLMDLLLVVMSAVNATLYVLSAFHSLGSPLSRWFGWLAVGSLLLVVADVGFAVARDGYFYGHWTDFVWLMGYSLFYLLTLANPKAMAFEAE